MTNYKIKKKNNSKKIIIKKKSKKNSKKRYKLSRTIITTDFNYNYDYDKIKNDKTIIINNIEYPYLKYFTTEQHIINNFNNLKKFTCKIVNENYKFTTLNINDIKFKNLKNNKDLPFLIIDEPSEYNSIEVISDYFNENCRVRCKFASAPGTQLDFFKHNFDKRNKIFKKHLGFFKKYISFFELPEQNINAKTCWLAFPKKKSKINFGKYERNYMEYWL